MPRAPPGDERGHEDGAGPHAAGQQAVGAVADLVDVVGEHHEQVEERPAEEAQGEHDDEAHHDAGLGAHVADGVAISASGWERPTIFGRSTFGTCTISSAPTMARKVRALMKNDQPGPRVASTMPPSAGPKARAALNCAELRVTALSRCSRGTSSVTNACHEAMPRPAAKPFSSSSTRIDGDAAHPGRPGHGQQQGEEELHACR